MPYASHMERKAEDTDTIDGVVGALYATISGPAGPRDWTRLRPLFAPGARLLRTMHTAGTATAHAMSVEDFVTVAGDNLARAGFFEIKIARRTEEFGHIAHVFSTYEARHSLEEPPFARGINSLQLFFDGARWQITSLLWDNETTENPIPAAYLTS